MNWNKLTNKIYLWLDIKTKRKDGKKDFCSCAPDVLWGIDISEACRIHDEHYAQQKVSKEEADIQLRENIIALGQNKLRFRIAGWIYYLAVKYLGRIYSW